MNGVIEAILKQKTYLWRIYLNERSTIHNCTDYYQKWIQKLDLPGTTETNCYDKFNNIIIIQWEMYY